MIDCVVSPVDQLLSEVDDDVKTTEPPSQNVVVLPAVIVGVAGVVFTVTEIVFDVGDTHVPSFPTTEYVPAVVTVIDCVVAPVDQTLFVASEEVKTTESPEQNVVAPPAVITGVVGIGLTVTEIVFDEGDEQLPLSKITEYEPAVLTVID